MKRVVAMIGLLAPACAPAPAGPTTPNGSDPTRAASAFESAESEILRDLAAVDRRFAARARITPQDDDIRRVAMGAVLAEDATLATIDGVIDPFSFEARARGVAAARAKLDGAPAAAALPSGPAAGLAAPAFERELLGRIVEQESTRLDEERRLPRSASSLLRAVIETWTPPSSPERRAERDRWLARRLGEITASLEKAQLDVARARELDDALDALEHLVDEPGFARSTAELVKLRDRLEALGTRPSAPPTPASGEWDDVAKSLRAHLGDSFANASALEETLARAEKELRARAEAAVTKSTRGRAADDALASRVAPLVQPSGPPCLDAVPGSAARSMEAPPERAASCRLRHAIDALPRGTEAGHDELAEAAILVAMHDAVVVAWWALDVASGKATLVQTSGRHRPLARPGPDVAARWERIALARPAAAIGGGVAVTILYGTRGDYVERSRRWSELGEIPLDIAQRELSSTPRPP